MSKDKWATADKNIFFTIKRALGKSTQTMANPRHLLSLCFASDLVWSDLQKLVNLWCPVCTAVSVHHVTLQQSRTFSASRTHYKAKFFDSAVDATQDIGDGAKLLVGG